MEAVRWHGNRDVRVETVELALPLGPGMLEAEVAFCGICGSDVAEYAHGPFAIRERRHPLTGQQPPLTLGHEFSARVVAVGDGVAGVAVGDRVAADACWRCGSAPPHPAPCRSPTPSQIERAPCSSRSPWRSTRSSASAPERVRPWSS